VLLRIADARHESASGSLGATLLAARSARDVRCIDPGERARQRLGAGQYVRPHAGDGTDRNLRMDLAKQALFYRALHGMIRAAKTDGSGYWGELFEHHMRTAGFKDRRSRAGANPNPLDWMHAINAVLNMKTCSCTFCATGEVAEN
jgi:hypothetical protein